MRTTLERSSTMCTPSIVGSVALPPLIGYVATTLPLSVTVISWVSRFANDTRASPTEKCTSPCPLPHIPLPALQSRRSHETLTCSCAGQYAEGRKCSSSLLNQCHPPSTGCDSVMSR